MIEISVGGPGCSTSFGKNCIRSNGETILFDDILTVQQIDEKNKNSPDLEVTTYVEGPKSRRVEKKFLLKFSTLQESEKWLKKLRAKTRRKIPPHRLDGKSSNRVLVLVNPYSGQKKAVKCWTDEVEPILKQARIEFDLVKTEKPGHGTELALRCDIDKYDAVLIDSGDGLISEFLHGILLRKDRERAMKFPICHIPGGTSNGLAAAVCYVCNEKFPTWSLFPREMALMVARPRYLPLRLFRVDTEKNGSKPMFLSATWGLIADIDIGSERFRWTGMLRLHIEAYIRVMQLPRTARYPARVSYVPLGNKEISRKTRLLYNVDRKEFGRNHFDYPEIEQATTEEKVLKDHFENVEEALKNQESYQINPLHEPLDGEGWVSWESEFAMVCLITLSHLTTDCPILPSSRLNEDFLYLMMIEWNTIRSRFQVADLFISMDSSKHLPNKCLQLIPVRACRVEPLGPHKCSGYFAVDGEAMENNTAFQVVPTRHCATVIGRSEVKDQK